MRTRAVRTTFLWSVMMPGHSLVADAAGLLGLVLLVAWPLLRTRRSILAAQTAGALAFALHYLLIGATTGAAAVSLSAVQALAAIRVDRPWWCRVAFGATIPALAGLAAVTWTGWPSAMAAVGLALTTAARWQRSVDALRALFLASAVAWVAHDLLTGSVQGVIADVACAGGIVYRLWMDRRLVARGVTAA